MILVSASSCLLTVHIGLGHTFPGYDKLVALTQADIELACEIDGDDVEDTPIQAAILADCSDMAQDSCPNKPGLDPVRNYMNYCDE